MSANKWGERLRAARVKEGDTQDQAAWKLGIKERGYLSNLELGKKRPSVGLALKIESIYGVPIDLLRSAA